MPRFAVSEPRGPAANVTPCPSEVAQLAERLTVNQNVVGSSPTLGAKPVKAPSGRLVRVPGDAAMGWVVTTPDLFISMSWVRAPPSEPSRSARRPSGALFASRGLVV